MKKRRNRLAVCALVLLLASCGGNAPAETTAPASTIPEEAPISTTAPAETEAPISTTAPAKTEAPISTTAPDETEAPISTTAPAETEAPISTTAPAKTEAPISTTAPAKTEAPISTTVPAKTEAPISTTAPAETEAPQEDLSVANRFLAKFETLAAAGGTAEELAAALCDTEIVPLMLISAPIGTGWNSGFTDEIDGFTEGATFRPMIGTVPFVGYVFRAESAADADALVRQLTDLANPRWNICTGADETVVKAVGDYVFFLMAPLSFTNSR